MPWNFVNADYVLDTPGRHTPLSGRLVIGAAIAVLALTCVPVSGQDVTEPALKSAFIHHFVKFTEWPAAAVPAGAPLVICVLGDAAVGVALEEGVKGRPVAGHVVTVRTVTQNDSHRECHLLYVSGITADRAAAIVAGLGNAPVLTISDIGEFTARGGIARLFFEHGRLRFSIHNGAAKRAGLQISSKVLELSRPERSARNGSHQPGETP